MTITPPLLDWLTSQIRSRFGTISAFAEKTASSKATWATILRGETRSMKAAVVEDIAKVFNLDELDLYLIANPERAGQVGGVGSLQNWLESLPKAEAEHVHWILRRLGAPVRNTMKQSKAPSSVQRRK